MADFKIAVQKTLVNEGGFQNDPKDWANWEGGKAVRDQYLATKNPALLIHLKGTKYGITAQDMPGVNIRDLTPEQATAFYSERYWKKLYSQIDDQLIAEKLFDMGVLFGVGTAVKMLQISMQPHVNLVSDGNFGPNTLNATNTLGNLDEYKKTLSQHAIYVAQNNPEEADDVRGWVNRIDS